MTNPVNLGPGKVLPCGCYLRPDEAEPRFWFCDKHGGGHAHMSVVRALLQDEPKARQVEPFVVKHYASDERPTIKGNGFDGLEVGADRQDAEDFVKWLNERLGVNR